MAPRAPEPQDLPPYRPQFLRNASSQSKLSVPLSSQSNEADDEESSSDPDASYDMESHVESPQYDGEDTRLTSDRELSGFYMYGWAAEVYSISFMLHYVSLYTSLFPLQASSAVRDARAGPVKLQ